MPVGRKQFDGKKEEDVIAKCKEVWAIGGSDAEASFYAEVSASSLSRYLDANPEVKEIRNALHEKPILKARQEVIKGLNCYANAMDYLKRKRKNEFGDSTDITSGNQPIKFGEINDLYKNNSVSKDSGIKKED